MRKKLLGFGALVFSDMAVVVSSFFLAYLLRKDFLPGLIPFLSERPVFFHIYTGQVLLLIIWIAIFQYEKLYVKRFTFWDEARLLLKSNTISFAIIMILVFATKQYVLFSRIIIFLAWIFSSFLLPISRSLTKRILIYADLWKKKVVIIGTLQSCGSVITIIKENLSLGYDVIGCLTDNPEEIGKEFESVKVFGHFDDIEDWKEITGFEDIIVTLPDIPRGKMLYLLKRWEQVSDTIRYIPRTGDLISTGIEIENIGKILSLTVRKNLHKPWNIFIKNIFEFFTSLFLIVLSAPLILLIAAVVKLDSRGSIFFVQERMGKRGKKISLIKFRTMFPDGDSRLQEYLSSNPTAQKEWEAFKKLKRRDPRVTGVGKFLRKHSLDELPQLLNVLKGDMSLVGPRPYILEELKDKDSVRSIIYQVRPGITGLWQISGRSNLTFENRLDLDETYIRNWSLWLDIIILFKTVKIFISGDGAY